MQGERSSIFKNFLLNPLMWIAMVLTSLTISNMGKDHAFDVFLMPITYRNLFIGALIYVALFARRYTKGMCRLAFVDMLKAILETMGTILIFWVVFLLLFVNYHKGGEMYSEALRERYQRNGMRTERQVTIPQNIKETFDNMPLESGKKYKVTPHEDGSITIEVE